MQRTVLRRASVGVMRRTCSKKHWSSPWRERDAASYKVRARVVVIAVFLYANGCLDWREWDNRPYCCGAAY